MGMDIHLRVEERICSGSLGRDEKWQALYPPDEYRVKAAEGRYRLTWDIGDTACFGLFHGPKAPFAGRGWPAPLSPDLAADVEEYHIPEMSYHGLTYMTALEFEEWWREQPTIGDAVNVCGLAIWSFLDAAESLLADGVRRDWKTMCSSIRVIAWFDS